MLNLPEPPNATSLSTARLTLSTQRASLLALQTRIADAEQTLADLIAQHEHDISVLRAEQNVLERSLLQTQAYVAPIRRLPGELLSEVFMAAWDDNPCIAWVLAGVSRGWRNTALAMPRIWSKVRAISSSSVFLYRAFASLIADHADSTNHDSSRIAGHHPSLDLAHGLHDPARCRDLPPESEPEALGIIIVNAARELPAITPAAVPLAPPIAAAARPPAPPDVHPCALATAHTPAPPQ